MIERTLRLFDSHDQADAAARADDDAKTPQQRFDAFMELMSPTMQLPEDFKEFIELMNSHSVRYVMIGGFAYNLYRNPRATGDIDFFVASDDENENRIRQVLMKFGFGETLDSQKLLRPGRVIMLGRSPFRIDLLTEISAVQFDEAESTANMIQLSGTPVPVISPELLLKNKKSAARPKDLADAQELETWLNKL